MTSKPVYTCRYFTGRGTTGYEYKAWKTPKAAIRHALKVKAYIETTYGEVCTIKCERIPAEISWHTGPEYKFTFSTDECDRTPGYQKVESFTRLDGDQFVNFYRNCPPHCDYSGSRIFPKEEWERVAPPARN